MLLYSVIRTVLSNFIDIGYYECKWQCKMNILVHAVSIGIVFDINFFVRVQWLFYKEEPFFSNWISDSNEFKDLAIEVFKNILGLNA